MFKSLALIIASCVFGILCVASSGGAGYFLLFALFVLVVMVPIFFKILHKSFDIAEAAIWFSLLCFGEFGVRGLYDYYLGSAVTDYISDFNAVTSAMAVSLLGLVFFWAGYKMQFGKAVANTLRPLPSAWRAGRIVSFASLILLIGWGFRLYLIYTNSGGIMNWLTMPKDEMLLGLHFGKEYFSAFSEVLPLISVIMMLIGWKALKSADCKFLFYSFMIPEIGFRVLSGARGAVFQLLFSVVIVYYLISGRSHKTSMKYSKVIVAVFILFFLLFPALSIIRGSGAVDSETVVSAYSDPSNTYAVFRRLMALDSLAWIIDKVPNSYPYLWGHDLPKIIVAWIPRALWHAKPFIGTPKILKNYLIPITTTAEGGADIPILAEFYWNFGLAGVFAGMVLIGIFFKFIHEYLVKPENNMTNLLVYGVIFSTLFTLPESGIAPIFTLYLLRFVLAVLCSFAVSDKVYSEQVHGLIPEGEAMK
jgi:oligosaccharide repeat unit polymerase